MTKKVFFGISYVSLWVIIWGTVGSLIDLPLLNSKVYIAGSLGQITTFFFTAIISGLVGKLLYPKILSISFIANIMK